MYACLSRLVLQFFLCSEHVWLLELGFSFLLCFFASLFLGWGFEHPCARMPQAYVRRSNPVHVGIGLHMQASVYICKLLPKSPNLGFCFVSFVCFVRIASV